MVPNQPELATSILKEFHSPQIGGHSRVACTKARIASLFYWPTMAKYIKLVVSQHLVCQQAKSSNALLAGLLQPLPISTQIWEDVAMDFIVRCR